MDFSFLVPYFKLSNPLETMFVTQGFGLNPQNYPGMNGHDALDLRCSTGTPCFAPIDATCVSSGEDIEGGRFVKLLTDPLTVNGNEYKLEFLYYHLESWSVRAGERVYRGQPIGVTDNTGKQTSGSHLHFRVIPWYKENNLWLKDTNNGFRGAVDPKPFLTYIPMANNPYNIPANTLIQLTEGVGGFGLWSGEKFYVDALDKILASWVVRNKGNINGKTLAVAKVVWDAYKPHYNLKNQPV